MRVIDKQHRQPLCCFFSWRHPQSDTAYQFMSRPSSIRLALYPAPVDHRSKAACREECVPDSAPYAPLPSAFWKEWQGKKEWNGVGQRTHKNYQESSFRHSWFQVPRRLGPGQFKIPLSSCTAWAHVPLRLSFSTWIYPSLMISLRVQDTITVFLY